MEGLIPAAAAKYHGGDEQGAIDATDFLMARYPGHRRVLHAAVALGALGGNSDTTEQASRLLQARSNSAFDLNGRYNRVSLSDNSDNRADVKPLLRVIYIFFSLVVLNSKLPYYQ